MSSNLPPSGGHPGPRQQQQQQQQNYPVPQPQHRHQGHSQYPRPQNWQQTQPNMSRAGPGQVPDPQFSYPLPQGMVAPSLHPHQHYQSSRRDSSQISPAESEFGQSTSPSETSDSQYSSHLIQYPPPQGYYPQMPPQANAFVPQPYALYPGQVAAHPPSWNQVQMPLQQQQPGSQMQFLPQLQQQQLQQWDANHPSHFQGYGYPHHYGSSSYASPTSSRNSSGRMEHLRSSGTSASGSGGRKSPRNNHPRQDSVAASLASSENSFSPYGNVPGQSPRPSDSSSPGNPPPTQGSSFGNTAPSQAETEPAPRSDFVLWCGNVPSDASVEELWTFFSRIPAEDGGPPSQPVSPNEREATQDRHGILSIFIISRSNCAFINYISDSHLQRALSYFHGKIIRPHDTRCQRLVVRIRKKGDEQMSGVSGQRGKGMHVAWIKEQERKKKEAVAAASALGNSARTTAEQGQKLELPSAVRKDAGVDSSPGADSSPEQSKAGSASGSGSNPSISGAVTRPSPTHESSAGSIDSSNSFTSTNSSLFRHPAFRTRYFILKSANVEQLDKSVESGEWRTQPHNEAVLDQAFRNSEDVILVFSANQSGNFYGYAKMKGLISPHLNSDENPSSSSKLALSSTPKTETIAENDDEDALDDRRGSTLKPEEAEKSRVVFSPQDGVAPSTTSPLPLTPGAQDSDSSNYFPPQTQEARTRTTTAASGASWPPISNPPHQTEEERRASASPSMLVSLPSTIPGSLSSVPTTRSISETGPNPVADALPSRTSTATPTTPSGIPVVSVEASDLQPGSGSSSSTTHEPHSAPTTLGPAPIDQFGVTRRDMINGGSSLSSNSLGPQDSISWPDSRAFSELAIRAVIHNLRLEEKESLKEAREASAQSQQLESSLINKNENQSEPTLDPSSQIIKSSAPAATGMDQVGKPFPIEWKETRALPFSVVRNLRNPWRDNRQIKVSRDGTELEPSVGKALLEEWEKAVRG